MSNSEIEILPPIDVPQEYVNVPTDVDDDMEFARDNLKTLVNAAMGLFQGAVEIAQSSQQAPAFDAAANVLKTIVAANKELMTLHKVHKDVAGLPVQSGPVQTTQKLVANNVYVGSTADFLKMVREKKKNAQTNE